MERLSLEVVEKLDKDLKEAARNLKLEEVRYLVDLYYQIQEYRKASDNQARSMDEEPSDLFKFFGSEFVKVESNIRKAMDIYTDSNPMGVWMKNIRGIGPVLSAGLLAHINIEKSPTVGHIWRFAGLDSTKIWLGSKKAEKLVKDVLGRESGKVTMAEVETIARITDNHVSTFLAWMTSRDDNGKPAKAPTMTVKALMSATARRPWNARLKVICWKLGESFVKVKSSDDDIYGRVYDARKEYEQKKNEAGEYAEQAREKLEKVGEDTEARAYYKQGKLPPGHIHSRAKRYAVKMFLSDLHAEWYRYHFKKEPPKPFAIAHLGHVHERKPSHVAV